ncbi:unnamed protein product [Arabis nemorensis]|uniref:Uncharacterized protein n=1 Tax=Arabis nemorensis TaxID=586526 RepID=A0A565B512_9BRAS|nr:unnamed protein product [Arabis nemorensis]
MKTKMDVVESGLKEVNKRNLLNDRRFDSLEITMENESFKKSVGAEYGKILDEKRETRLVEMESKIISLEATVNAIKEFLIARSTTASRFPKK